MNDESHRIAENIRNGQYFSDARSWYKSVYVGVISERSFVLMVALIAGGIALLAVHSVSLLMPLTRKVSVIIPMVDREGAVVPRLHALRGGQEQAVDAVIKMIVRQYVSAREGYSVATRQANANFVRAQSSEAAYATYFAEQSPTNPNSQFARFKDIGAVLVSVESTQIDLSGNTGEATVYFSTQTQGVDPEVTARWQAKLSYSYQPIEITMVKNSDTGIDEVKITDPHFQVVSYVVEKK